MKPRMTSVAAVALLLILAGFNAQAETLYVSDTMKITLRTGPGNDRKIIALIRTGQMVEPIERGEEWSHVRLLPDGKEGWVLSRFLTAVEPSGLTLQRLSREHAELQKLTDELRDENNALQEERQRLAADLETSRQTLATLRNDFETLKSESTEFLALKAEHKDTRSQLAKASQQATRAENELTALLHNRNIKWFLSGAGVLFVGFLLGYSAKRQRRRSSLL